MNAETKIIAAGAHVYSAIAAVTAEIAKEGIAKSRKNEQQGYKFRGIDDVLNALAPLLSKHKLCVLPRMLTRHMTERTNSKGNPLFFVTVEAEFDFVSAEDGTAHVVRTFGEAMDSADKATNKAMSAAYKYAALLTFSIPTEGDADATTHEIASAAYIDDHQWAQLTQLIEATGADTRRFCEYMQVPSLRDIRASDFARARKALESKVKKAETADA